jgi:general secretion pathway protein A
MYEAYWNLREKPFENTPDPRFIYYSKKHEEALMRMMYAVKEDKGAAMLTGEYGSGKTLLSRIVIDELIKNKFYEVALVTYPQLSSTQFIQELIYQLENVNVKDDKPLLLHRLQDRIYRNFKENKKTVIIIDEAQIIRNKETFEELRLLLNFQLNDKFLLNLMLIGQPELLKRVASIPQLDQRMGIKYHLDALDRKESEEYINNRLAVAGRKEHIFTVEALDAIYDYSGGIPRKINNVCDIALLIGFGQEVREIDKDMIQYVVGDLTRKSQ